MKCCDLWFQEKEVLLIFLSYFRKFNELAMIRGSLYDLKQNTQVINVGTTALQWGTNSFRASGFHCKEDVCSGLK